MSRPPSKLAQIYQNNPSAVRENDPISTCFSKLTIWDPAGAGRQAKNFLLCIFISSTWKLKFNHVLSASIVD
ncbi:hypothetical protein BOTCAL_0256g00090 [Botryotinia calthae]|uniref:Uncharacterized protein n=1 Tax=Botryotinia calthae TaxID=38488 RepID=A0A4Y8CYZ2_9HELO|nr:hypothetical protein BOTCAL_0256g00090 [Botryotinia calthae]